MPAKKADKAAAIAKSSKSKKKKWSKGKTREKLNNAVLFEQATYDKLMKDVPAMKVITPAVISDRMKITSSLARAALRELEQKGMIKRVIRHRGQVLYTRFPGDAAGADE
eukprot:CAMPEP_0170740018 /NCGR_PEP_ID=MMETSP0437-20130122/5465_1 /TAXON_ID=0 /ORGANISM="Sexangularia sp." /LENGTH=109 /DNA_ID=CAMNT_0011078501 /DNA_START=43 /DNA_END=372 /DNA_ORIENTATION=-